MKLTNLIERQKNYVKETSLSIFYQPIFNIQVFILLMKQIANIYKSSWISKNGIKKIFPKRGLDRTSSAAQNIASKTSSNDIKPCFFRLTLLVWAKAPGAKFYRYVLYSRNYYRYLTDSP